MTTTPHLHPHIFLLMTVKKLCPGETKRAQHLNPTTGEIFAVVSFRMKLLSWSWELSCVDHDSRVHVPGLGISGKLMPVFPRLFHCALTCRSRLPCRDRTRSLRGTWEHCATGRHPLVELQPTRLPETPKGCPPQQQLGVMFPRCSKVTHTRCPYTTYCLQALSLPNQKVLVLNAGSSSFHWHLLRRKLSRTKMQTPMLSTC